MGIFIFLGIFFLISLIFTSILSIIMMNLRIIEIPPKYAWMNAFIFVKRNAIADVPLKKDKESGRIFGDSLPVSTINSTAPGITTIINLQATAEVGANMTIGGLVLHTHYWGEEENPSSANRGSIWGGVHPARKPSDFQRRFTAERGVSANEANC